MSRVDNFSLATLALLLLLLWSWREEQINGAHYWLILMVAFIYVCKLSA